ncbi:MAG: GNAT family N-acetyltransferase [Caldilinea sp. CFX5]|nr:GNAT family N-acetyltransferase [Caldilinea sp. CFX5]
MFIRPATEADRTAILGLMRPGDFNRVNLQPVCFLVAEEAGRVIGIGQVKRHRDGTPELASLVVAADRRGEGIGQALVRALVAQHGGPLYLFCLAELEGFYARLGFRRVERQHLPRLLALIHGLGNSMGRLPRLVGKPRLRVIAMRTEGGKDRL